MAALKSHEAEDLFHFAVDAIRRLGEASLSFYGKGDHRVKFDEELVTQADLHVTQLFQEQLHARFPEHRLFQNSQENKDYTHEGKRHLWIHDPLDGVANFQAGIPVWGISLALLENYWPVFGLFYMPATGDLFHARAGSDAFREKETIRVSAQDPIDDESLLLTYSRFHHQYRCTFPGKIRNFGCTTAHVCYVAGGCAEAALIANESFQGLAAARVIIEAAGGKLCKIDGSRFSLNEYLDGQKIEDDLLAVAPDKYRQVRDCLDKTY